MCVCIQSFASQIPSGLGVTGSRYNTGGKGVRYGGRNAADDISDTASIQSQDEIRRYFHFYTSEVTAR